MLKRCTETESLISYWWKYKIIQPLWEIVCHFLIEIYLTYNPGIALLGLTQRNESLFSQKSYTDMIIAALFVIARN